MVADGGITLPVELEELVVEVEGAVDVGVLWSRLVEAFNAADIFAPGPLAAPVFAPGVVLTAPAAVEEVEPVAEVDEDEVDEEVVEPVDDVPLVEEVEVPATAVLLKLRRRFDRLPRSRGEISEAKFSA